MAVNSQAGNKLLAWLAAGTGTLLAYSAYKNRLPWDVLRDIQGMPISAGSGFDPSGVPLPQGFGGGGTFASSVPRIRMIANREIPPDLVPIRPSGRLDRDAAAALGRAQEMVGTAFPNTSAYRSFGEQSANYYGNNETLSDGSPRFGRPERSLHVVGLAIDIRQDWATRPEVITAMSLQGWQRSRPSVEPWHWSYLVSG